MSTGFFGLHNDSSSTQFFSKSGQGRGRDDHGNGDIVFFSDLKNVSGKTCTGNDQVNSGFNGGDDQFVKIFHRIHDIDSNDSICCLFGLFYVFSHFISRNAGTPDNTNAAAFGDRYGQGGCGDANGHSSLD